MPWHKARFYYDHSTGYRKRILHRLDLSILVATALLVVTLFFALGSLQTGSPLHFERHGFAQVAVGGEPGLSWFDVQQVSTAGAIVCAVYLFIAIFLRSRS